MIEQCPVFVMNDEEIVDVFYAPLEQILNGWRVTGTTSLLVNSASTHTIMETPIGCFQLNLSIRPGETLNIQNGGGVAFQPCQRMSPEVRQRVSAQI